MNISAIVEPTFYQREKDWLGYISMRSNSYTKTWKSWESQPPGYLERTLLLARESLNAEMRVYLAMKVRSLMQLEESKEKKN